MVSGGFNPSPFGGPIAFGPADPYGAPGGFGPDPFGGPMGGPMGGLVPDPFGGPGGFGLTHLVVQLTQLWVEVIIWVLQTHWWSCI